MPSSPVTDAGENKTAEGEALSNAKQLKRWLRPLMWLITAAFVVWTALDLAKRPPINVTYKRVQKPGTAISVARAAGISPVVFQELNPDVRQLRARLPKGFRFAVPSKTTDLSELLGPLGKMFSAAESSSTDG